MPTRILSIDRIVLTIEIRLLSQIGVTHGERPIAGLAIILKLIQTFPPRCIDELAVRVQRGCSLRL